jgi:hypothetical protein
MTEPNVIARRATADGKHVCLWSDGYLTWALGFFIKGAAKPRTEAGRDLATRAGWLVLGDVELYEASEITNLVKAARWTASRDGLPGTMRQRFTQITNNQPALKPHWQVIQTNRDGKPTVRAWILPRLGQWAGLTLWDEPHHGSRYHLLRRVQGSQNTYGSTGFAFNSIRDAVSHLKELSP